MAEILGRPALRRGRSRDRTQGRLGRERDARELTHMSGRTDAGALATVRKALAAWDKSIRADLTVFGHFHQRIDGGDFMCNGSLIGFNAYAQSIKASFEQPQQSFYLISARNGGEKSITAPIWVTPAKGTP